MKNIFSKFNLSTIKEEIKIIFSRFSISIIYIFIATLLMFILLHGSFSQVTEEIFIKGIFTSIIAFFLSLGLYIYSESSDYSKSIKNGIQIFPIIYSGLFFLFMNQGIESIGSMIFLFLSLFGVIGFLFFAPYVKNIYKNDGKQGVYYSYFYNVSVVILTSSILGGILFGLGAIGITAVHGLFDLSGYFQNEIYGDWAIVSLSLFTPLFALTKIPKKSEFRSNQFNENIFFSFLVKYIAIPFIYIYFIILYAYSLKVLLNFSEWPKGEVTWMVIGFSIFGYLAYIFSYIFEEKNNFIKIFRKYFPYVVIPQVFMLFYAIYLRINQYDITVNRYFVVVFGLWLLFISLYYVISKKKYLGNLAVLLTLFTLIISVGPWSVYNLPESRQTERLKDNLIQANILQGNDIIPLTRFEDIDRNLSKNIYGGIDYLCNFNSCYEIKKIFPKIYSQLEKEDKEQWEKNKNERIARYEEAIIKYENTDSERVERNRNILKNTKKEIYSGPNRWRIVRNITETIKVKEYFEESYERPSVYIYNRLPIFPLDIANYSQIIELNTGDRYKNDKEIINFYGKLDIVKKSISIINNGEVIDILDIENILSELLRKNGELGTNEYIKEDFIYEINTDKDRYKVIFQDIELENPDYNGEMMNYVEYYGGNGYILIQ